VVAPQLYVYGVLAQRVRIRLVRSDFRAMQSFTNRFAPVQGISVWVALEATGLIETSPAVRNS
jgi:hypothetical protein